MYKLCPQRAISLQVDNFVNHAPLWSKTTWQGISPPLWFLFFPFSHRRWNSLKNAKAIASLMSLKPGWKWNSAARMQWQHLAAIDQWPQSSFCHLWCAAVGGPGRSDTLGHYPADVWSYPVLQPHCKRSAEHLGAAVLQIGSAFILMYNSLWFSTNIHNGRYVMAALTVKSAYDKVPGIHNSLLQSNSFLSFPILFPTHFENWLVLCLHTRSEIATTITSSTHSQ